MFVLHFLDENCFVSSPYKLIYTIDNPLRIRSALDAIVAPFAFNIAISSTSNTSQAPPDNVNLKKVYSVKCGYNELSKWQD